MFAFDLKHWWNFGSKLSKTTNDSKFSSDENREQSTANKIEPKLQSKNFHTPTEKQKEDNLKLNVDSSIFDITTMKDDEESHGIV